MHPISPGSVGREAVTDTLECSAHSATQDVMTHVAWSFPQWGGHVCTEILLPSCLVLLRANGKVEAWRDGRKLL